jgi:hypothetical protein
MKIHTLYAMTALGLCACTLATAAPPSRSTLDESGFYVGAQASQVNYKEDGFAAAHPTALSVMGGWRVNPWFGVEARLGAGVASDSIAVPGVGSIDLKLRSYFSLLMRGTLPVSDHFDLYAVGGRTRADFSASAMGASVSGTDANWTYGVGMEFLLGASHSGVSLEAGRLLSGSGYDADIVSIGFRHNF